MESGRLSLVSPFKPRDRRPTAKLAEERNRFVAALATEVFVAYTHSGGKTEQLCRELVGAGKPVFTFHDSANARLIEMGCKASNTTVLIDLWQSQGQERYQERPGRGARPSRCGPT